MGQQINGSLPPLYLQWKGNSITIVGIREVVTANGQHPPSFTLIIFCPQKNVSDIKATLIKEFESELNDFMITEQYTSHPNLTSSSGGKTNYNNWPVLELPANKLLQKDCQILLSTARVIDKKESNRRKFCSINLGFLNAVSNE
jgi:hypothetical protein